MGGPGQGQHLLTLILSSSQANTYTIYDPLAQGVPTDGGPYATAELIMMGMAGQYASTGSVTVDSGSTLNLTGTLTYANALNLNGTGVGGVGAVEKTGNGTTTVTGPITLAGDTTIGSAAGTLALSTGGITGTNTNLTLNGAGASVDADFQSARA